MPFEPLSISKVTGLKFVTLDKSYRLRLSVATLKELGITTFTHVIVSVDVENKRVGIVKQELAKVPNATPVRPDKRGYLGVATGKNIADKLALTASELPCKFEYVGRVDEGSVYWHGFQLVKGE